MYNVHTYILHVVDRTRPRGVYQVYTKMIFIIISKYHLSVYLIRHEVRSCSIWFVLIGSQKMKDASTAVAMQLFWYPSNIY